MFTLEMKEYELNILKANHVFEMAMAQLDIEAVQINDLVSNGYITESSNEFEEMCEAAGQKFVDAIKNFFKKIKDAVKSLIEKIQLKIQTEITKRLMNKKLSAIKKELLNDREAYAKLQHRKFTHHDTVRYLNAYKKYINWYVSEVKKAYNAKYDSVDDYNKAMEKLDEDEMKIITELGLNDEETWVLSDSFDVFYTKTEKEVENIDKVNNMIQTEWEKAIKELEEMATNEDDAQRVSGIKKAASKIQRVTSSVASKSAHFVLRNLGKICSLAGVGIGISIAADDDIPGAIVAGSVIGAGAGVVGTIAGPVGDKLLTNHEIEKARKKMAKAKEKMDKEKSKK